MLIFDDLWEELKYFKLWTGFNFSLVIRNHLEPGNFSTLWNLGLTFGEKTAPFYKVFNFFYIIKIAQIGFQEPKLYC